MLVSATSIINHKIFALDSGKEIGTVKDIIFNHQENRVMALMTDKGGIFTQSKLILMDDIQSIGKDAVIVPIEQLEKKLNEVDETIVAIVKQNQYLDKTNIVTENGDKLGQITDIFFDDQTGLVQEFEVSGGILKTATSGKKVIKIEDIVTIGHDVTIVRSIVEEKIEHQSENQGIQGALHDAGTKSGDIFTTVKEKAIKIKEKIQDPETQHHMRRKLEDLKESVTNSVQQKTEQIIDKKDEKLAAIESSTEESAIGKYVSINVLTNSDLFIAHRGDIVTHELLHLARENDVLNQVLDNISNEPV